MAKIYKEYEFYLQVIRDLLFSSVEKGFHAVCSDSSIRNLVPNENKKFNVFEKKIKYLINAQLPLITIEQLKIFEIAKNKINQELNIINISKEEAELQNYKKEDLKFEDDFISEKTLQFDIDDNISNTYEFYQSANNFLSLDLDNRDNFNSLTNLQTIEQIGLDKKFITSLLELIEEDTLDESRNQENLNNYEMNIANNNPSLKVFDLIDISLTNLLLNLSYQINTELFKSKIIKKIISLDAFKCLTNKKFMIKHPHPFVINFDLNIIQSLKNDAKLQSICLLNINIVELEFKNLNLAIQRNKINELKNKFQSLIKKERYWKQKEINLNKIQVIK